ncbi:MAG: YdcF family protein [Micropruina sp.]|uniref:YdcF family protein n=1 Tax=Micropruina sp. TaxID=2737536 RepID=UPI0039E2AD39
MLELPTGVIVLLVALVVSVATDPRKLRTGLYLLALLSWLLMTGAGLVMGALASFDQQLGAYAFLALVVIVLGTVLALAGFLIVTGITLLRREGWAISRLLGLGVGAGMLGYLGLWVLVVVTGSSQWALALLLLGLPLGYLGFGFVAFLLYGTLYPAIMARRGGPVAAVVVLGSGLIRAKVPPLLAARLNRGRALYERFANDPPVLVTSGGQGPDEPVAEGEAMASYLAEKGFPADRIVIEDRSRTTEQNLAYSAELLKQRDVEGPIAAVTNNFHAFRAALLMRRLGIPGYSVGAPTARYYWPSAVIREFIAVLRDHLVLNAVLLGLACLPVIGHAVAVLVNR